MKLVKTDTRNKLSTSAMTDTMRINLLSPSVTDFDPTVAIHVWNCRHTRERKARKRRPHYISSKATMLGEVQQDIELAPSTSSSTANQSAYSATNECNSDVTDVSDVDSAMNSDFTDSDEHFSDFE